MKYTTQVHKYTLKTPTRFNSSGYACVSIRSVDPINADEYLKDRTKGSQLIDNGIIDAIAEEKLNSVWDTKLYGYKSIHTSRDSRGCFICIVHVPSDWDANHPIVQDIRQRAKGEARRQDSYYSQPWV